MNEFERYIDELCCKGRESVDDLTRTEKQILLSEFLISGHDKKAAEEAIYESNVFQYLPELLGKSILDSFAGTATFMAAICAGAELYLENLFNDALEAANEATNKNWEEL